MARNKPDLQVGTITRIRQILEIPSAGYKVLVEGIRRARILSYETEDPFYDVSVRSMRTRRPSAEDASRFEAGMRLLRQKFEQYVMESNRIPPDTLRTITGEDNPEYAIDAIAYMLDLEIAEKQAQLEQPVLATRLRELLKILDREIQFAELQSEIEQKLRTTLDKNQRDYYLREQIRALQSELGEQESSDEEEDRLLSALEASNIPEEHRETVEKEIRKLSRMAPGHAEASILRNWIELMLELPFGKIDEEELALPRARRVLERDHYGLKKVKERILEYIAVRKLQVEQGDVSVRGPILCLVGPPGVGKTSVARSIAEALGRKFSRMSLGGIRDEAEIRGHRRTYIGAMPGRILSAIRHVKTDNPLILLDEIDKLGRDFRGDPASALLEVLDPEQNVAFRDNYVEIPYDLSKVLFLTTANTTDSIPLALLDRMEIIEVSGYTDVEKVEIARRHLIPKQLKLHGLDPKRFSVTPAGIRRMISWYTREAGVRQLERELARVCRRLAIRCAEESDAERIRIGPNDLEEILGKRKYRYDLAEKKDLIGCATRTSLDVFRRRYTDNRSQCITWDSKLVLAGHLGDVMRESAQAASTYIRSRADMLNLDALVVA